MFLSAAPWLMVALTLWPTQINGQRFHSQTASCHLCFFFCCLISPAAVDSFLGSTSCPSIDGSITGCTSQKTGNGNTHAANSREWKLLHVAVSKRQAVQGKFVGWHHLSVSKQTENNFRSNFSVKLQSLMIQTWQNNVGVLKIIIGVKVSVQNNQVLLLASQVKVGGKQKIYVLSQ